MIHDPAWHTALAILLLAALAAAGTDGWDNPAPGRGSEPSGEAPLWRGEFTFGLEDWLVEFRGGAQGSAVVASPDAGGPPALRIVKENDCGHVVVRSREGVVFPAGRQLQLSVRMWADGVSADYSLGMVRLLRDPADLAYDRSQDGGGGAGPHMQFMMNTPAGVWQRRLAHAGTGDGPERLFPAVVVAGRGSVSWWRSPSVEDFGAARAAWNARRTGTAPRDCAGDMLPEDEFEALLERSPDHVARLETRDGRTRLLVDGRPAAPVMYKAYGNDTPAENHFHGRLFSGAGIGLQVINIRYGSYLKDGRGKYGIWTRERFDVDAALKMVRDAMRTSPDSCFLLTLMLNQYPEFGLDHPGEVWRDRNGRAVYGNHVHVPYVIQDSVPAPYSPWASCYSREWRRRVRRNTGRLIEALRRTRLSRRIVGVHLAGGHDMQFATRHLDYSRPALDAFREFLRCRYRTDEALRKAWRRPGLTFAGVRCPRYPRQSRFDGLAPGKDQDRIDFFEFQKTGAFAFLEELGRFIKEGFGKDILLMRWCMEPFSGTLTGSLDIGAFLDSDVFDVLVAQSSYSRRPPGIPHGVRLPLASFHLHGKLFLEELDLRTWRAASRESELRCLGLGVAMDLPMWRTLNRRLTGQMIASGMGFWYYDMAPGWFDDPGIAADLQAQTETQRRLLEGPEAAPSWRPGAAFVVDEKGLLLRNIPGLYYVFDVDNIVGAENQLLAASGVPYDFLLLEDLLRRPALGAAYRTIVFAGMYDLDPPRLRLLKELEADGRTLVFLAGTGRFGGLEEGTGFRAEFLPMPVREHWVEAVRDGGFLSWAELKRCSRELGRPVSAYHASPGYRLAADPGMEILARYRGSRMPAVAVRRNPGWTGVYVAEAGGLGPEFFNELVAASGGHVAASPGLQVDLGGGFLSAHGIVPGRYGISLPVRCRVVNLKTGAEVSPDCAGFPLDAQAGSTYWFRLLPPEE